MHSLELRKTRKYVGTYAHLDEWEDIGSFEHVITGSPIHDEDDYCEGYTVKHLVSVTSSASPEDIKEALINSNSRHGCAHEYDCCGCRSYSAEVEHLRGELWLLTIRSSRNY